MASLARYQDELGYRYFLTEAIRLQGLGKAINLDYYEYRGRRPAKDEDFDEIVDGVAAASGITIEGR